MDLPDAWRTPAKPAQSSPVGSGEGTVIELPKSKAIARLRYHPSDRSLVVEFRNGSVYRYFGVPAEDFEKLRTAESPGARFNQDIQPYHEFERLA